MSIFKELGTILKPLFHSKPVWIMLTAIILLLLYGTHGNIELLGCICKKWSAPGVNTCGRDPILSCIPWDREFISFFGGFFLLVIIPCIIIKFGFKDKLSDYGLGLPAKEDRKTAFSFFLLLFTVSCFFLFFTAKNTSMQAVYPFYKTFKSIPEFTIYELTYLPFFIVIEFIFRGYILLGLANNKGNAETPFSVGIASILISMLAYNIWHLGKPLPELWSTPVWGIIAGAGIYRLRSIWPVVAAHWLMNVWLDGLILYNMHLWPN
jgi:membrane protease YdiL (CAAX protease family)